MKNKYNRSKPFVTLELVATVLASILLLLGQIRLVHSFAFKIRCNLHELGVHHFSNRIRSGIISGDPCRIGDAGVGAGGSNRRCCCINKMGFERSSRIWSSILSEDDSFDDYNSEEDIYDKVTTDDEYDEDLLEFEKYQVGEVSPTLSKNDSSNLPPPPPPMPMYDDERSSAYLLPKDSQLQLQIQQQQKQIDLLMEMIKGSSQGPMKATTSGQSSVVIDPRITKTENVSLQEEETLPPPLPGMFDDEGEDELLDTTNNVLQHQQQQQQNPNIKQSSYSTPLSFYSPSGVVPLAPLKAMLFIDGTWLYYSLYRRKEEFDPIVKKFGKGWQYRYRFDWNALPRIICEQIVGQQMNLVSRIS
jgi:hypothetical protein